MRTLRNIGSGFVDLYRDGFRNMTWGKPLVWLIVLKLAILFLVLRLFFFRPAMSGLTDEQKAEKVSSTLTTPAPPSDF
ncbi:MAG: DUF4492 domain-containing protein [Paludibacteraceae bacterium]|nr:DUF4492 domain-containing protein [Paludibacteraceae bacterium]